MKKIIYIFAAILAFNSCGEFEQITYDPTSSSAQSLISFVGIRSTQPVIIEGTAETNITVQVSTVSSSERTIQLVATDKSTATSDQYTISNLVIPANEYSGTFTVKGIYDNIPEGNNFLLELKLQGLGGNNEVLGSDTFSITLFRFCPVQIGDYVITMRDSYGDGWQTTGASGGAGMTAKFLDSSGAEIDTVEFGMCSPYGGAAGTFLGTNNCTPNNGSEATTIVTVPAGTADIVWSFPGDNWGEISFEIAAPNGNTIYNSGAPGAQAAGDLPPLVYCL